MLKEHCPMCLADSEVLPRIRKAKSLTADIKDCDCCQCLKEGEA